MQSRIEQVTERTRRAVHGSSAWSLPRGLNLRQPQDGASSEVSPVLNNLPEPEDARLTGGTRSLTRRLMGLNVAEVSRKPTMSALPLAQSRQAA